MHGVPVSTGPVEVCYSCQRHFHPDDMGFCGVCGANLCLDLPTCPDRCRCDEAQDVHPVQVPGPVIV
jgi:hypothetical protein